MLQLVPPLLLAIAALLFYLHHKRRYAYWPKRGLATPAGAAFPFGHLAGSALGRQSVYTRLHALYAAARAAGQPHVGVYAFGGPVYLPVAPRLVGRVLQADFGHFSARGTFTHREWPLSRHVFAMAGERWRRTRARLSPAFTAAKLRAAYPAAAENCERMRRALARRREVELKGVVLRFAADTIGASAFGVECDSLLEPSSEFARIVDRISHHSTWELLKVALLEGLQNPGNIDKIAYCDPVIERFFTDLVRNTIDFRDENNVKRADFLNALMEMRDELTLEDIVAECYLFFIAGFKTSAFTICYCLHELAHDQTVQTKLRTEIFDNLGRDSAYFSIEALTGLRYLDQVLKETMRKYPPLPMLNRVCTKDYQVPGTDVIIEKGTPVVVPVIGLHWDPELFPEPQSFKPERFDGSQSIVAFSYLPFGDGPRNCIGLRFGMVKTKLAVASLLANFRFLPSPKTPKLLQLDPCTTSILFNVPAGIYTQLEPIPN